MSSNDVFCVTLPYPRFCYMFTTYTLFELPLQFLGAVLDVEGLVDEHTIGAVTQEDEAGLLLQHQVRQALHTCTSCHGVIMLFLFTRKLYCWRICKQSFKTFLYLVWSSLAPTVLYSVTLHTKHSGVM